MIVTDTNLIAHCTIDGEHSGQARTILQYDAHWAAPVLWRSELRNVLMLYMRRGLLSMQKAVRIQDTAEQMMAGREHIVQSSRVLQLAAESGCTAYDCEFVAVAEHLGVPLITFDCAVLHAFPQIAMDPARYLASGVPQYGEKTNRHYTPIHQ